MSDEIEAVTEGAKAVQETGKAVQEIAKTGRALIEPGTELANYVARVLGTVPEYVVGFLIGDPLRELRQHTLTGILRAVFEKLRERGVETAKPIRPGPGKEAFEAASLETDETLQDMWSNLLANAMDPSKDTSLQRVFIETLKQFEPIDALVLNAAVNNFANKMFGEGAAADLISKRNALASMSAERLAKLGCFWSDSRPEGNFNRKMNYLVSNLGTELYRACNPDAAD